MTLTLTRADEGDTLQQQVIDDMHGEKARKEYLGRINAVIDYVRENLEEELSVENLAEVAGFSPFHFHRIFSAMVGETLKGFVRRIRLEKAATLLLNQTDRSLTDIALSVGFSSSSTFTRAFQQFAGTSPGDFRRSGGRTSKLGKPESNSGKADSKNGKALLGSESYHLVGVSQTTFERSFSMKVSVQIVPSKRVAYVRHVGYGNTSGIKNAFDRICKWGNARGLFGPKTEVLGICNDNPHITPHEKWRYDAAITVGDDVKPQGEVGVTTIPEGKYAICHFEGKISEIGRAWAEFMNDWLPQSGFQSDDRPCFENYLNDGNEDPRGIFIVDLYEPVRPL